MASRTEVKPLQKYSKDATGSTIIPATKRPDGSMRKPIRVKEGFVPQEEIPVYQTKPSVSFNVPPSGPFGLDPSLLEQSKQPPSKSAKKRAKQKEKKAQEKDEKAIGETVEKLKALDVNSKKS